MLKVCYIDTEGLPELMFQGSIALEQIEHAFESVCTAPGFPKGGGMLVDVTNVDRPRSEDEIRELATFLGGKTDHLGNRLGVVVSPSNPAHYGTARMLSSYAEPEGLTVRVFTSVEEASAWLHRGR